MCVGCAPRISCSRTIDDEMLARPVKVTDLLLLASAHPVPMEDCFRRWQSMARSVSNSLIQWAHLKPRARGAFLTGRLSWPVGSIKQEKSLLGQVIFLGQLAGRCREETCSKINKNKRETKYLFCHAHRQSCISYWVMLESWRMWNSATKQATCVSRHDNLKRNTTYNSKHPL